MNRRRVALVSGANRGIGLEVCRQLASHGLRVITLGAKGPTGGFFSDRTSIAW